MSSPVKPTRRALEPARLIRHLGQDFPSPSAYRVAFSGGLDSTVLLRVLAEHRAALSAPLRAVHVDHQLQPNSASWAAHCAGVCDSLSVPLTQCRVDARPGRGESPEAAARAARYAAFAELLEPDEMLLTAHHLDDQAETLLLQLLRAAGVAGLAAMPSLRQLGAGWHARPLLGTPREALQKWAGHRRWSWIDDPTNAELHADRNYVRHVVMPAMTERWPTAASNLTRSAGYCSETLDALTEQAGADLQQVRRDIERIDLRGLAALSAYRQRAVLLRWLSEFGVPGPSASELAEIRRQLLESAKDATPVIELGGRQLRRFGGEAWLIRPPPAEPPLGPVPWPDGAESVELPYGRVERRQGPGGVSPTRWDGGRVSIGFREPGLTCRPVGRKGHRDFKSLAQENRIPPWQRAFLPILLIDDRPAAVANCCVCEPFGVGQDGQGWLIHWSYEERGD